MTSDTVKYPIKVKVKLSLCWT